MEQATDLVSAIIPNYNHGPYLRQRLDTVLAQTYPHLELIILDDCSTDDSRSIIESYRDHPRVSHIVFNEKNTGSPFKQWIKGIELASGSYIWIAESDDWCEPNFVSHVVEPLRRDERGVVSYCQSHLVSGNHIEWQSHYPKLLDCIEGTQFVNQFLFPSPAIFNASMAIWKKSCFPTLSSDFLAYRYSGDWLFWIELCSKGPVYVTGSVLNYFRKHTADMSSGAFRSGLNFVEALQIINSSFTGGFINKKTYESSYKRKFKEFWLVRDKIERTNYAQIMTLLRRPITDRRLYQKALVSAVWNSWKSGKGGGR